MMSMGGRDELDWIAHIGHELKWLTGELTGAPLVARQLEWTPRVDMMEAEEALVVRFELAGVTPGSVQVVYNPSRHTLSVRGQRGAVPQLEAGGVPILLEIDAGPFAREVELPPMSVAPRNAKTHFRSGILTIVLPKVGNDDITFVIEETITVTRS
jgi:HSP20 family molecular chaperone IbpA